MRHNISGIASDGSSTLLQLHERFAAAATPGLRSRLYAMLELTCRHGALFSSFTGHTNRYLSWQLIRHARREHGGRRRVEWRCSSHHRHAPPHQLRHYCHHRHSLANCNSPPYRISHANITPGNGLLRHWHAATTAPTACRRRQAVPVAGREGRRRAAEVCYARRARSRGEEARERIEPP